MSGPNYVLDGSNAAVSTFNFLGATKPAGVGLGGLPLGLVNGEVVLKVAGPNGGGVLASKQETDSWQTKVASYTIPAGALSIGFSPSSDFVGTVQGVAWTGAQGPISRVAQPGNTLPTFVITMSGGTSFTIAVAT